MKNQMNKVIDSTNFSSLSEKYAFLRSGVEIATEAAVASFVRKTLLGFLGTFFHQYILVFKGQVYGSGPSNPRIIVPSNTNFPDWKTNHVYAFAYERLYLDVVSSLSEALQQLFFDGALVVYTSGFPGKDVSFALVDSTGVVSLFVALDFTLLIFFVFCDNRY